MAVSALYPGGNRHVICSSPLPLFPGMDKGPLRITRAAVAQVGLGNIHELLPVGVRTESGTVERLPAVRIRSTHTAFRDPIVVLQAPEEESRLCREFDLPQRVLAAAYFRLPEIEGDSSFRVAPVWPEVLEPDWLESLGRWVREPGGSLPDPDRLPGEMPGGVSGFLPGAPARVYYPGGRNKVTGEFQFQEAGGFARVHFISNRRKNNLYTYSLSWQDDRIVAACLRRGSARRNAADGETFDPQALGDIYFDRSGERREYVFTKKAGSDGLTFAPQRRNNGSAVREGQCKVLQLFPSSLNKIQLEPGRLYPVRAVKDGRSIFFACYLDAAMTQMVGWGRYNFDSEGSLRGFTRTLNLPADPERPAFLL